MFVWFVFGIIISGSIALVLPDLSDFHNAIANNIAILLSGLCTAVVIVIMIRKYFPMGF